jgi:8-oxo-dGTP pyrophosphatase MutT (NUDIX family)
MIILDDEGRVLLLKDSDGMLETPGGGIEHEESIDQAIRRECMEELGVVLKSYDSRPLFVICSKNMEGQPRVKIYFSAVIDDSFLTMMDGYSFGYYDQKTLLSEMFEYGEKDLLDYLG